MQPIARLVFARALLVAALLAAGCSSRPDTGGGASASGAASPRPTQLSGSVQPPPTPESPPPTSGARSPACVDGWSTPSERSAKWIEPLRIIRRTTGWRLGVTDMRYFHGPESPPREDKPYLRDVERWYVKGYARSDPALRARFLVEGRVFGDGIAAVAPFGSRGWRSPDWTGFQLDTADPTPHAYPGLPGTWAGTPYDFVQGGEGLSIPGLPHEVVGCLDGT